MAINNLKLKTKNKKNGFTIFFAMLVGGLALAVGAAIFDLTVRELDLSATATQSQYAIYAADTGAECALYWDVKCPAGICPTTAMGGAFATSSLFTLPPSGILCGTKADGSTQDITTQGPPLIDQTRFGGCPDTSWCLNRVPAAATTTFTIYFAPQPYCATVEVAKSGSPTVTTITSHGYNTCTSGPQLRLERILQVSY